MSEPTAATITLADLLRAQAILDENGPVERRAVYPKRWAKVMRERGTWDDNEMLEEQDIPIGAGWTKVRWAGEHGR